MVRGLACNTRASKVFYPEPPLFHNHFHHEKLSHTLLLGALSSILCRVRPSRRRSFTLVNRTDTRCAKLRFSIHKNAWGKDRMGDNVLDNGKSRLFSFPTRAPASRI
jgi:hypothetical protein